MKDGWARHKRSAGKVQSLILADFLLRRIHSATGRRPFGPEHCLDAINQRTGFSRVMVGGAHPTIWFSRLLPESCRDLESRDLCPMADYKSVLRLSRAERGQVDSLLVEHCLKLIRLRSIGCGVSSTRTFITHTYGKTATLRSLREENRLWTTGSIS